MAACGARAQSPEQLRRIAVLVGGAESDPKQVRGLAAFKQALSELGWVEGRNVTIHSRYTVGEKRRAHTLAREVVKSRYEVILAGPSKSCQYR